MQKLQSRAAARHRLHHLFVGRPAQAAPGLMRTGQNMALWPAHRALSGGVASTPLKGGAKRLKYYILARFFACAMVEN
jgi:hypothetical protein